MTVDSEFKGSENIFRDVFVLFYTDYGWKKTGAFIIPTMAK